MARLAQAQALSLAAVTAGTNGTADSHGGGRDSHGSQQRSSYGGRSSKSAAERDRAAQEARDNANALAALQSLMGAGAGAGGSAAAGYQDQVWSLPRHSELFLGKTIVGKRPIRVHCSPLFSVHASCESFFICLGCPLIDSLTPTITL